MTISHGITDPFPTDSPSEGSPLPFTPRDLIDILGRRRWSLLLPAASVFGLVTLVALLLPASYRSSATILIEEQEIPSEYVMATVTSYAEKRLETLKQRIMTTSQLLEIVDRFELYTEVRDRWTTEEIVDAMREAIRIRSIDAEVLDRRTGRATETTIAFTLAYEGRSPRKVHQVAGMLTSLFLEENLRVRREQSREATRFLEEEMAKVQTELTEVEARLSKFKEQHINVLPELLPVNLQTLSTIERNVERLEDQLRSLKEREGYLQAQLVTIPPEIDDPDRIRLRELKTRLIHLLTQYSDEYPDVKKTRREIADLEKAIGGDGPEALPDNPGFITLASQLASVRTDISSVHRQLKEVRRKAEDYRGRIERTPRVEEQYNSLSGRRNSVRAKLDDLMRKLLEARVALGLEEDQKGERFTLVEPANFPERPFKPNRKAIVVIGLVLGIGAGIGAAALFEFTDLSVRDPQGLIRGTGFPVLGGVPVIVTPQDRRRRRLLRTAWILGCIAACCAGVAVFHFWIMDLDVFWAKVLRKLDRLQPFQ
jgi:polysaccharide biosynthesis transport protein